ncbi:MAG: divalent-cation tolerance protein CutA [Candidatus Melainabacteria bacterium]|nr:MAG: divalent-cation tolerance protein CutA [Candidatus Melainabacteria bacterium]
MAGEALVLVTCGGNEAGEIARSLVEERLAACVSVLPRVTSTYRFRGEVHKDEESLLLIKTNKSHWPSLKARVLELNSYEVPEIILLPIEAGHGPYLDWLNQELNAEVKN